MSRTKEWLMDQVQADVDELLARVGHLEAGIAQLLAALEAVASDIADEHSEAWISPPVRRQVLGAIERGKAVRS
jgi:hypothetical protein